MQKIFNVLLFLFLIFLTAVVHSQDATEPVGYGITGERAKALIGAAAGLISLITGAVALIRSGKLTGKKRSNTIVIITLLTGLTGLILSLIHLGSITGDFGTGGGKAGAIAALLFSVIGLVFGSISILRYSRKVSRSSKESAEVKR